MLLLEATALTLAGSGIKVAKPRLILSSPSPTCSGRSRLGAARLGWWAGYSRLTLNFIAEARGTQAWGSIWAGTSGGCFLRLVGRLRRSGARWPISLGPFFGRGALGPREDAIQSSFPTCGLDAHGCGGGCGASSGVTKCHLAVSTVATLLCHHGDDLGRTSTSPCS